MARPGIIRNRKFVRLTRALGNQALALGSLELLWSAAYESGEDAIGTPEDVETLAAWQGEPGKLFEALRDAGRPDRFGFIEEIENRPGVWRIHDLWDHAPDYVRKRRSREQERQLRGAELARSAVTDRSATGQGPPNGSTPAPTPISQHPSPRQTTDAETTEPPESAPELVGRPAGPRPDPGGDPLLADFRDALGALQGLQGAVGLGKEPGAALQYFRGLLAKYGRQAVLEVAVEVAKTHSATRVQYLTWWPGWMKTVGPERLMEARDRHARLAAEAETAATQPAGERCTPWRELRAALESKLRPDLFERWFSKLQGHIDGDALELLAPTEYDARFLADQYATFLAEELSNLNHPHRLRIIATASGVRAGEAPS